MSDSQDQDNNDYSIPERIVSLFQSKGGLLRPKIIANELNIKLNAVNTALRRLKNRKTSIKDFIVTNMDTPYGFWKLEQIDNEGRGTTSQQGGRNKSRWGVNHYYRLPEKAKSIVALLLDYNEFHGLSAHLPTIDSSLQSDEDEPYMVNDWKFSVEGRKFRVRSTHNPIPFEEIPLLIGAIQGYFQNELNYDGLAWLTHIELNRDIERYKLDGIQRIEVGTFLNNTYRLYNKEIDREQYLRSECIIDMESGTVPLAGGIQVLQFARNIDNMHTLLQQQYRIFKQFNHTYNEIHRAGRKLNGVTSKLENQMDMVQNQVFDLHTEIEGVREDQRQGNSAIVEGLQILHEDQQVQILQNEVRQHQLGTIIQQNDLIEDRLYEVLEEVRQLKNNNIEWRQAERGVKLEILERLRDLNLSWNTISEILKNYDIDNTAQAYSQFVKYQPKNKEDTTSKPVKKDGISDIEYLKNEYDIEQGDSQDQQVLKVVKSLNELIADQVIQILPHIRVSSIRRSLSRLKNKDKIKSTRKFSDLVNNYRVHYHT